MPRLTVHQKRVLAALALLEHKRGVRWWTRDAIGYVVQAGGYHETIQRKTMGALKRAGLVQTERSSWPEDVRQLIQCDCACCEWGLTASGRRVAASLAIRWTEEGMKRVRGTPGWPRSYMPRDEEET